MANIEKRESNGKASYRVKVRLKGYPIQTATFARLTDAKRWAQNTESAIREGRHFKTTKSRKYTLSELIDKYEAEILSRKPNSTANQKHYLKWWKEQIGSYVLADVTAPLISEYRNKLVGETNKYGRAKSTSTANRFATALGHVFTVAVNEWELIEHNPVHKISKLPEPTGRTRFLSDDERKLLLESCKESENPYLYTIVVLALSTGARKNELLSLKWQDIDFSRYAITLHKTKNSEKRSLPLKGYAQTLMEAHKDKRKVGCDYVFPSKMKCQPIDIRTSWENAVKRSGIDDFRFHDLRHSAASYLAMGGASLPEIAEVLGHKTFQMVKRYAHLSDAHTASVVERMNAKIFGGE
jgi:integrase